MNLPVGYTQEETLAVIEQVVGSIASKFKFGSYEVEDMRQEGRAFALECLSKYDPNKGASLKTFVTTHVRNQFINLQRKHLVRHQPPCTICPFYNKAFPNGCSAFKDKMDCDKWESWVSRNISKKALSGVCEDVGIEKVSREGPLEDMLTKELREIIDKHLPAALRNDFRKVVEKQKIPKHRKIKIVNVLREIVKEYYDRD